MASVERYDTENQVWDSVAPVKIARSALSLTVLDGKLYAMGGFDGHSFLSIVEIYDPIQDKWEESTPLSSGRSGHASAVIYQPSCVNQYMDCVEDQINRSKKPPNDDDTKPGPSNPSGASASKGPTQATGSSGHLHAFSGNRCDHCENENTIENQEDPGITKHKENFSSKYEQQCRNAIHCLLQMDHKEKQMKCEDQSGSHHLADNGAMCSPIDENARMEVSDEETNDYDSFVTDNPKKLRRKESSDAMEINENSCLESENSNSVDSSSSLNAVPGIRNRPISRCSDANQCSLSRLKNKVRQNIRDFVAWSVSQSPQAIPQDTNSNNNLTSITNDANANASPDERQQNCDLLQKYYKCN